ncbi:MAG: hypothetical protein D6160_03880 [Ketobacter sp.]|nr:MAG: hypothetical protein D6160_03880 [Ketobacter sp.]
MKLSYHPLKTANTVQRKGFRWPRSCALAFLLSVSAHNTSYAFEWFGLFGSDSENQPTAEQPKKPVLIDQPHAVEDLAYGDLLFDFYQQKYFSAITKILVAKERGQLDHNREHAELVLGSLYVSYGMLERGEAIFNRLLNTYTTQKGADESWYQLARIYYKQGDAKKALSVLTNNIVEPVETRATEHVLLQVLCHINLGEVDQARSLSQFLNTEEPLSVFVRFNLGAALSQLGDMGTAAGYYEDVLENNQASDETDMTLLDRSALSLGIYYLQSNQLDLAEKTLNKIRLFGPVANRGLLALGWAHFESDRKIDALTPWLELSSRPLSDSAVQESILNVPFVYEELGALQDALDGYNNAYKTFQTQGRKLDDIKAEIMKPDWIEIISPADTTEMNVMNSAKAFELPADNAASQHLFQYYATNEFQRMYHDYRELQRLYLVLVHWERQIPTYTQMIQTHVERLNELAPKAERASLQAQKFYAYSRVKLDEFETKLSQIIADDDIAGTANVTQLAQQTRLDQIEATLKSIGDPDVYAEEWDKFRLLKGLLVWDLNAVAIEKRWQSTKDKVAIDNLLIELEGRIRALTSARQDRLTRFQGFETRASELQQRLNQLQELTAQTLRDQRNLMQKVAVGIIEKQQSQLDGMRAKALLSIARLQDLAYMQERDRAKQDDESIKIELEKEPGTTTEDSDSAEESESAENLGDVIENIFSDD